MHAVSATFFGLPAAIERRWKARITTLRLVATSAHVERGADGRAPTPDEPLASHHATVAGQRRDTDQHRGDLLAVQAPELRHIREQCAAHHRRDRSRIRCACGLTTCLTTAKHRPH